MIVEKYNLIRIISYDIFRHGFIQMILLIVIIISAISIITVSYETRLLTAQKDLITEENDLLDIEWRNLILEEISLGNHNRIERLAIDKLHMIHVNPMQEHILIAK
ncbi:cell division protein FtsL [Arsenophonus sp.]|uniref:cell division protein FtsL n=1 Tax=Arsenophonus sp. TaxID=1872640 RepID=UPI0038D5105D